MTALDARKLRSQLHSSGYVVVPAVVPKELVEAAASAVWERAGADPADPESWYGNKGWNIRIYQHGALWDVRQHPRLHEVFAALLGETHLWVSVDSACFKPPQRPEEELGEYNNFIHFDRHPVDDPAILQGLVSLTDTGEDMGGFQCAPDSISDPTAWLARPDFDAESFVFEDHSSMTIERPATSAGDLIVFSSKLAHGNGMNTSRFPRLAQYVTMGPAGGAAEAAARVDDFKRRLPPEHFRAKSSGPEPGLPPELTGLGRKLLGAEEWIPAI